MERAVPRRNTAIYTLKLRAPSEVRYFKRVQEAWEILSDPEKRRQYDAQLGRAGRSPEDRERHGRDDAESTTSQLPPDLTVMKVGGASSFLTISEHFKRNWKEAAGCDLSGMTFDGVSFRGATLTGAKLDGSSFIGCDFSNADLTDCSARSCDFHGARFSGADLERTMFSCSNLQNTVFLQAHILQGSTHKDVGVRFTSLDTTIHTVDSSVKTRPTLVKSVDFGECDLRGAEFCLPLIEVTETANDQMILGINRQVSLYFRQGVTGMPPV